MGEHFAPIYALGSIMMGTNVIEDLKFEGKGGKEAEDFVAAVKKIALKQGKHQDSEWTAAFASSCFCGTALRWFEDLDEAVQSDWKLLRRAILQQWPAEARAGGSSLPTSAAAPPLPATVRTATAPAVPTKALSPFKCLYCKAQNRPVDEEFCSARCQDDASRAAPLLIKLEATDPIYKEVNALFGFGWQNPAKPCPSVKRIFRIMMKPTLTEYYNAYRRAVEEQGKFASKSLKPGNEKRIWAGVRRSCSIGDDWDFGGGRLCNKANCELCKILQDSFEVPKTGIEWLPFGAAIRGTTASSKADEYSVNGFSRHVHNQKALLLASVVMGEVFISDKRMTSLPAGFQSISCEPGPNSEFNYNETAVYNEDAIRPAFLVIYDAP